MGMVSPAVRPYRGVVPGCGFATTVVNFYTFASLDHAVRALPPNTLLDGYVDGGQLDPHGVPEAVVCYLSNGAEAF